MNTDKHQIDSDIFNKTIVAQRIEHSIGVFSHKDVNNVLYACYKPEEMIERHIRNNIHLRSLDIEMINNVFVVKFDTDMTRQHGTWSHCAISLNEDKVYFINSNTMEVDSEAELTWSKWSDDVHDMKTDYDVEMPHDFDINKKYFAMKWGLLMSNKMDIDWYGQPTGLMLGKQILNGSVNFLLDWYVKDIITADKAKSLYKTFKKLTTENALRMPTYREFNQVDRQFKQLFNK